MCGGPLPKVKTLFVWDFDWTITNCNSDEYIPAQFLGDDKTNERFRELLKKWGPGRWHECVAAQIDAAMTEHGASKDDLVEAASSMPCLVDVRGSLGDVADARMPRCGQAIISDGNDWFIGAFLGRNVMEDYFTHGIETNRVVWENKNTNSDGSACFKSGVGSDSDKFRVIYQSEKHGGHTCERCPPNLCKTQVLRQILERIRMSDDNNTGRNDSEVPDRPRVVYVGDGSNDACPALHVLAKGDVLLARGGQKRRDANSKRGVEHDEDSMEGTNKLEAQKVSTFPILSTLQKAEKNENLVPKCRVNVWKSGKELRSLIGDILSET